MSTQELTVKPRTTRRAGYVAALVVNLVLLWVMNNLLAWGWPPFLTDAFSDLLPYVSASLIASAVANAAWVVWDPAWFRHLVQIGVNIISLIVAVKTWQIFPFDFSSYSFSWEVLARVVIAVGVFGVGAATVVELTRLLRVR